MDGDLLQNLRSLAGWPAKILNSELLVIRYLRDYALGFVSLAMLRGRLALPPSDGFAMPGEVSVHGRQNRGVEANALTSIGGNRQNAWFFRRRVGTRIPFPSALIGAIRSKPVKDRSEGAGDDGECDYQARLPRHQPETESSVARNEVLRRFSQGRPACSLLWGRGPVSVFSASRQIESASRCGYRQNEIQRLVLRCVNSTFAMSRVSDAPRRASRFDQPTSRSRAPTCSTAFKARNP